MPDPEFVTAVLDVTAHIPAGRVMTYGDVAQVLHSRAARQVGQIMARWGHEVPWWRVVPASGEPPAGHRQQAYKHYRSEQTPLRHGNDPQRYRLDLTRARLHPTELVDLGLDF